MCVLLCPQVWERGPFPELGPSHWLAPVGQVCVAARRAGAMERMGQLRVAVPARSSRTGSL